MQSETECITAEVMLKQSGNPQKASWSGVVRVSRIKKKLRQAHKDDDKEFFLLLKEISK